MFTKLFGFSFKLLNIFSVSLETLQKEILWASNEGKADLVESILMRDPSCINSRDEDGYTPLHRACYSNHLEIVKILLQYGADVNAKTEYGWTPLHSAVKWSNTECAALLLQHGSDPNAKVCDQFQFKIWLSKTYY